MNRWNIPAWLETEVLLRDTSCIYCRIDFSIPAASRGEKPSWEHIVNDETIINRQNISRCCMSCNSSKGAKNVAIWHESAYCKRKGISKLTVAQVVREALANGN